MDPCLAPLPSSAQLTSTLFFKIQQTTYPIKYYDKVHWNLLIQLSRPICRLVSSEDKSLVCGKQFLCLLEKDWA